MNSLLHPGAWSTANSPFCSKLTFFILLTGIIVFIAIMASVPPVSRDALTHHLAVPKLYLENGKIYELPTIPFSYYPMNIDLLYLLPLYFKKDIGAKYIHFSFALLTALFIYIYLRRYAGKIYGALGVIFFLTLPVIVKLSVTVYVDLGLIFFSWVSLYYLLEWYSNGFKKRYLTLSAVFCGLGLGTKYNGLLLLPIMGAFVPLLYSLSQNQSFCLPASCSQRYRRSASGLKNGFFFILIALLVFSPWMIRNYRWKHNPVYPFYNSWFNKKNHRSGGESSNPFKIRRYSYHESFLETISIPVRVFFQGRDDNPKYFDGKLNPFLLLFSLAAFWKKRKDSSALRVHKKVLAGFSILFIAIALFTTDMRIRYVGPMIPPLVVLSILGLKKLIEASGDVLPLRTVVKTTVCSLLITAVAMNMSYMARLYRRIDPMSYLSGKVSREEYIKRRWLDYPVVEYANGHLPRDANVLFLSMGNRTYFLNRNFHLCSDFYRPGKNGGYSEGEILEKLRKNGTTHILVNAEVYHNWTRSSMDHRDAALFKKVLEKHTRLLFANKGFQLLALVENKNIAFINNTCRTAF